MIERKQKTSLLDPDWTPENVWSNFTHLVGIKEEDLEYISKLTNDEYLEILSDMHPADLYLYMKRKSFDSLEALYYEIDNIAVREDFPLDPEWFDVIQHLNKTQSNKTIESKESDSRIIRTGINLSTRFKVLARDGFRCRYCGHSVEDGIKLEVDHVIPVNAGGNDNMDNLITACDVCNRGKIGTVFQIPILIINKDSKK